MHAAALAALGCRDERELAVAIREGAFDDARRASCSRRCATIVRAKLEVANPGYLQTRPNHSEGGTMNEELPQEMAALIEEIDAFIAAEVRPLEAAGRQRALLRPPARATRAPTSRPAGSRSAEWEELLEEMVERADRAGLWRYALPEELGGRGGSNLAMAIVREHLNRLGIGLHNDPAERDLDDRQLPDRDPRARVRDARAAGGSSWSGALRREVGARVRPHRAQPRLRRDLPGDDRAPRGRGMGDRRHQALQLGHAPREPRPRLRPHLGLAGRGRGASRRSSCPATRPG